MPAGGFPEGGQLQQAHGLRWRDGSDREADTVYFDGQGNFVVRTGGAQGALSIPGGAMLRSGSGAPPVTLGTNGDYYFDSSGANLTNTFQKITGSWNLSAGNPLGSGAPGGPAAGVLSGSFPNPLFAAGQPNPAGSAGGVLTGTYPNPIFLAGAVTGTAAASDILRYSSTQRNRVYVPAGTTASQMNVWASTMFSAGVYGAMDFEPSTYTLDLPMQMYPNIRYDGNGSQLVSTGSIDTVQSYQFDTFSGTGATTFSGAPYNYELKNFIVVSGSQGRNAISSFGMGYRFQDLLVVGYGGGSPIWEEYGSNGEDWTTGANYLRGETAAYRRNITILDACPGASVNLPAANTMSLNISAVGNTQNPKLTTLRPHFLHNGQAVTVASVAGAVGVNGAWTVASVVDPSNFIVTTGSPGVFSGAVGHMTYPVSAGWAFLGPHDSFLDHTTIIFTTTVVPGRRGLMMGSNGFGSSTGAQVGDMHIYNNWDVGLDLRSGGYQFDRRSQVEGSNKCGVLCRSGGRDTLPSRIFGGFGGCTLLSIRDANQNVFTGMMHQGGLGQAPPTNFVNTYLETYNTTGNTINVQMEHDYNTDCGVTSGSMPTNSFVNLFMAAFGQSTATMNVGWAASLSTTTAGIVLFPAGLAATTS
jgi:hypothetical protein